MSFHLHITDGSGNAHYFGAFQTRDEAECEGVSRTSGSNETFEIRED